MSKLFWAIFYISINLYAQNYVQEQIPWVPDYLQDQQRACPQGYSFDYTSGNCVVPSGPSNSENCIENFETGEVVCTDSPNGKSRSVEDSQNPSSPQDIYDQDSPSNSRCRSAYSAAKTKCDGNTFSQSPQSQSLVRTIQLAQISGNTRQACEASKQLSSVLWSLNANFGVQCNNAVKACASSCASNSAEHDHCLDLKGTVNLAKNQAIENAKAYAGSEDCAVAASGCGANSYDDKNCPQYCQKPGRQNDPLCKTQAQNNCLNPQYASQNTQFCQDCLQNPQACVKPQNAFAEQPNADTNLIADLAGGLNSKLNKNNPNDFTGNESQNTQKTKTDYKPNTASGFAGASGNANSARTPAERAARTATGSSAEESSASGGYVVGNNGGSPRGYRENSPGSQYNPTGIDLTQFVPPAKQPDYILRAKGFGPGVPSIKEQEIAYARMELAEAKAQVLARKQQERELASANLNSEIKKHFIQKVILYALGILIILGTMIYFLYDAIIERRKKL